ncbi:hypothetical protein [Bacillus sp. Marseille-P3661]|uniref:hypothetical protein n=1 Tax=Bacillus sp. Marseille-P3661 TaxID=1936234 RepID=UPI000C833122|nr:hypothetical protein [Bacillus sp. Marseille-P3661]
MFSSLTTNYNSIAETSRRNPIIIEGTSAKWNNAKEVSVKVNPVKHGNWVWFKSAIQSNNYGVEPPFDGMISRKIEIPSIDSSVNFELQLKLYDPDGIIKYARAIVNDNIILNMGDWKLKKEMIGEVQNLQPGSNYILLEFKMKKKYPLTKVLLGTLKQTAVSACILGFPL